MVLPLFGVQRAAVVCARCNHENVRLAASVKRGARLRCQKCRKTFVVTDYRVLVGTAKR